MYTKSQFRFGDLVPHLALNSNETNVINNVFM